MTSRTLADEIGLHLYERMPSTARQHLFDLLDELEIAHQTVEHPPVFTVEESRTVKAAMPGGHSKNLFLKDKADTLTLVTAHAETRVDLKALGKELGAKSRLSFGKPDLMLDVIGIEPGSVTPFALINDAQSRITNIVVDSAFFSYDQVWFHPLENTASTALHPDDLLRFMEHCGYRPLVHDLGATPAPAS